MARLHEIPCFLETQTDEATKEFTLRRRIPGGVVAICHHQLHTQQATITGLMAACWIQAIHEVILANVGSPAGDGTPVVSISCLVALHSQLPKGLHTNAFGTATLASESVRQTDKTSRKVFVDRILDLAAECSRDLRSRIHRGEAANQSLSLCRGEFESSGSTPGTIELSNHGVYHTSEAIREVAMQQRFDGYDGVSVLMVSESHSQVMRLLANVGPMYSRRAVEGLMDRVVEIWSLISESFTGEYDP